MPAHGYIRTRGVRWNKDTESFEMWCPSCAAKGNVATFWPLTREFWPIDHGLAKCKACHAEHKRAAESGRRAVKRDSMLAANRAYYRDNRDILRWKDNQRKAARSADQDQVPA